MDLKSFMELKYPRPSEPNIIETKLMNEIHKEPTVTQLINVIDNISKEEQYSILEYLLRKFIFKI